MPRERLNPYLMIPVLIEQPLGATPLLQAIRGKLDAMQTASPTTEEFLGHLLRAGRVLVIVDSYSELDDATRSAVLPTTPGFPVSSLIITSRSDRGLEAVPCQRIQTLRIECDRLSSFLGPYLACLNKAALFTDSEFYSLCGRIKIIAGSDITVLLAKLFIDQAIARKEARATDLLPSSVPEIFVGYINHLDHATAASIPDSTVYRDSQIAAWECVKQHLHAAPVRIETLLRQLGEPNSSPRLEALLTRLRIIQIAEPNRDSVSFLLHPVAEYLASLHLLTSLGDSPEQWHQLMDRIKGVPRVATGMGFVAALYDCVQTQGAEHHVPDFVITGLHTILTSIPNPGT